LELFDSENTHNEINIFFTEPTGSVKDIKYLAMISYNRYAVLLMYFFPGKNSNLD